MKRVAALSLLMVALCGPSLACAQTTVQEARQAGKTMGTEMRADPSLMPSQAKADGVPGYAGTDLPQSAYFDDPDRLVAEGAAMAPSSDAFVTSTDRYHVRPTFSSAEILTTTELATSIETNPDTYLSGEQLTGGSSSCTPLPPGSGSNGYYEATCNSGAKLEQTSGTCVVGLHHHIETSYNYTCGNAFVTKEAATCLRYEGRRCVEPGVTVTTLQSLNSCTGYATAPSCSMTSETFSENHRQFTVGRDPNYFSTVSVRAYTCSAETTSPPGGSSTLLYWKHTAAPPTFVGETHIYKGSSVDASACSSLSSNGECTMTEELCTSSDPVTRTIDGVDITQPCWAWNRTYSCNHITSANDCGDLESNRQCTYVRDECIDDEEDPDYNPAACKVTNKVYRCPTPGGPLAAAQQFVCGDDVYCINGDCEPIQREASTEFKDALVALHSLDQAGKEFDDNNFTFFSGERDTCHKPVFGLVNCCAGKVSGLLTAGAGAAALAGGPGAIAALATPFLTLFLCDSEEMMLDIKDRMGFCHKVGTYCSSSLLGICKTKRTAYCCFESKLSRILQEQGRPQLGKPWGKPKKEQCVGFTIEEFSRLDLSVMDFTEVYAEFIDAAKLPDEIATLTEIQTKIQDYYELHGGQ